MREKRRAGVWNVHNESEQQQQETNKQRNVNTMCVESRTKPTVEGKKPMKAENERTQLKSEK